MYNKLAAPYITNWQHHGSGLPYNISSSERVKVDSKNVHHQLKDEDLENGVGTRKAINELKHSGKQRQCCLEIRSFFTSVI